MILIDLARSDTGITEQDALRARLTGRIAGVYPDVTVDLFFTCDEQWAHLNRDPVA